MLVSEIDVHIITWNRLRLTKLTIESLLFSLRDASTKVVVKVFDNHSNAKTRKYLQGLYRHGVGVEFSETNIGMAGAWSRLSASSAGDFILTLENDWFCNSWTSGWLQDALEILEKNPHVAFVKLRTLIDEDDWGWGKSDHAPWSLCEPESELYRVEELSNGAKYFLVSPSKTSFTFNPILMRKKFRDELESLYLDDPENETPLRSGEDAPSDYWRNSLTWWAAVLTNGPFRQKGFYGRFNKYVTLRKYLIGFFFRRVLRGIIATVPDRGAGRSEKRQ
jgi:hypothetical protein